ncbi:hypothetical protein GIB67_030578, partial [Kingdonia uniflora]
FPTLHLSQLAQLLVSHNVLSISFSLSLSFEAFKNISHISFSLTPLRCNFSKERKKKKAKEPQKLQAPRLKFNPQKPLF